MSSEAVNALQSAELSSAARAPARGQQEVRSIELELRAEDKQIQYVRYMVHSFMLLSADDRGLANRVALTTAELVECACREEPTNALLRLRIERGTLRVRVEASFETSFERAQRIETAVASSHADLPADAYTKALAARDADPELLMVGRLRFEGQMTVGAFRMGRRVSLFAEAPLPA